MKKFLPAVLVAILIMPLCSSTGHAAISSILSSRTVDNVAGGEGTAGNGATFDNTGAWVLTVADAQTISSSGGVSLSTSGIGGANSGTVTFLGASTVTGSIGSIAGPILAINSGAPTKTVTITGDVFAATTSVTGTGTLSFSGSLTGTVGAAILTFTGDGTVIIADTKSITETNGITNTGAANSLTGTIRSSGTSTVTGQVGTAALALREVSGGVATKTTTFASDVFANTTSITGAGTIALSGNLTGTVAGASVVNFIGDGTLTLADAKSITVSGGLQNTGAAASLTGTFRSLGTSTVTGQVGTAALALREVSGGVAAKITTFSSDVFANTTSITGTGTMIFNGNLTGTAAGVSSVNFIADGGLTIADNKNISVSGGIRNTGAANSLQGNLLAIGTTTVSGQVGTAALALTTIRAGGAAETVTFASDVFANTTSVTGTGTIAFSGSLSGTIAGTSSLDFVADGTVTLADSKTISVSGGITNAVTNNGTLILAGTNTITGAVGSTTAGLRAINLTSSTASTSTVFGAVKATGFSLGLNTLATTTITLPATGTIATTANSGTAFGKITSTGAATVPTGATVAVTVGGYIPNGATLVVVDGTGGTGVAASLAVTSTSPNVTFAANSATAADLTLTATRVTTTVTGANNTSTATAINNSGTPTGDFLTVLNQLDLLTSTTAINAAYSQLDPIANAGASSASFNQVNQSLGVVSEHLADMRNGVSTGGISTGDMWKDAGFWVKGFGNFSEQDARSGVNGYKSDMWGTAVGMDGLISDLTRLGFAGSYASTNVSNKIETGGTDINSYQGAVYLGYDDPSPWYLNGAFSFTWNTYKGDRGIAFTGVSRTAKADYDGQQYTGAIDTGYVIKQNEYNITPLLSFTYSHLSLDKYTETGANSLNLRVNSQGYDLAQSGLGVKLDRSYAWSWGTFVPEVHFKWLYDFIGDEAATTATFTGGGGSFRTLGADPAQSSYNAGVRLTLFTKGNITLSVAYDFETKSDYDSHTGSGTFRYNF